MATTNTDRIVELTTITATHSESIDGIRKDVIRIEGSTLSSGEALRDIDKRLAILEKDVARFEKRLDDVLARRWELWKLVLAAFLGGLVTLTASFLKEVGGRAIESGWPQEATPE